MSRLYAYRSSAITSDFLTTKFYFMQNDPQKLNSALQQFFLTCLQELYWSETNLLNTLMTMNDEATTPRMKQAFQLHADQTRNHAVILENVFAYLGLPPQPEPSAGLQG